MGRWACVDLPALPLQLLLAREPGWADHPACVVEEDGPQARVLWVNERARAAGILPGLRYAAALALSRDLRAGVVDAAEIGRGVARIAARLADFTPDVEASATEPGVFWLGGDGLAGVFPSASAWGRAIHDALTALGFLARIAVGFTRYGTYAVARGTADVVVFRDPASESAAARRVPLARLGVDPDLRDDLDKLGVSTLGEFLELPEGGVHERFGDETARLHRLASGRAWAPLQARAEHERCFSRLEVGYADADLERLLRYVSEVLVQLLARLAARHDVARAVRIAFRLDTGAAHEETVQPAQPTRDAAQLLELVRLRLEYGRLPGKVEEIELELLDVPEDLAQLDLLPENPSRPADAAERALARVRAEFGPASVVRAQLREGHLPEGSYLWQAWDTADTAAPARDDTPTAPASTLFRHDETASRGPDPRLVRRVFDKPVPLPPRPHHLRDDGWLIRDAQDGAVVKLTGPFVVSGGWWNRPVHREYHFAQTAGGDLLWVFYDPERRRWFLHGDVE